MKFLTQTENYHHSDTYTSQVKGLGGFVAHKMHKNHKFFGMSGSIFCAFCAFCGFIQLNLTCPPATAL